MEGKFLNQEVDYEDISYWGEKLQELRKKIEEAEKIKKDGEKYAANKLLPIVQEETKKIALEYKNITEEEANQLASYAVKQVKKKAEIKDKSKKKTKKPTPKPKGTGTSSPLWIPPLKSGGTKYGEYVNLGGYQR